MKIYRVVKKFVSATLAVAMLGICSFGSEYKVSYEKGNIVVSGITDIFGDGATLTAYPKGQENFSTDKLLAMLTAKSNNENGEIRFEFTIRGDREDVKEIDAVTIYVKENSKDTVMELTANYSAGALSSFISSIKDDNTADNVKSLFDDSDNAEIMNLLGIGAYNEIISESQKKDLVELIVKHWNVSRLTVEEIYRAFSKAYGVSELNAKGDSKKALGFINPMFEGMSYNEITDNELLKWLEDTAKSDNYKTVDAFESEYKKDNILYIINNEKAVTLHKKIIDYAEVLEIEENSYYKKYSELKGNAQNLASDVLAAALYDSKAKTVEELLEKIKSACKDESSDGDKKPGSSGGGSGGGGGGGKGSATASGGDDFFSAPSPVAEKEIFSDLDTVPWAKSAIEGLANKGIVNGIGNGKFEPDTQVSREQFVKMLVGAAGISIDNGLILDFKDVEIDNWSYKYIAAAVKFGIVNGTSENEFGMGKIITRQDAAVMAYRTAEAVSLSLKEGNTIEFGDKDTIADYAREAVDKMSAAGIINGVDMNLFAPTANCTRAQAAKIIWQMFFSQQ